MTTTSDTVTCAFVEGQWVRDGKNPEPVLSPYDGSMVGGVIPTPEAVVDRAVRAAKQASVQWWSEPAYHRAETLYRVVSRMEDRTEDLAAQMSKETGRAPQEARAEVQRGISTMRIAAEEATRISGEIVPMDAVPGGRGKLGFTLLSPVGVVAAITPFNAPLITICHKLGPALAGGNALVLKPHHHGSGVAALLMQICQDAQVPAGLVQLVLGGPEVGSFLTTHPDVAFVNFTGSGVVAERILQTVGLKRTLLELGGNAPTIIHHDADLDAAVRQCGDAAFGLAGQSCISTQRLYVHRRVAADVVEKLVEHARGRDYLATPEVSGGTGPLLTEDAARRVQDWIEDAVRSGATLAYGGTRDYTYVAPTVLVDPDPASSVVCEEIFGPVLVVMPYDDLDDALEAANDSPWGLKAGIFTNSLDAALAAATRLQFGAVNVNAPSRARVDQEPSGGIKQSGWGKEGPRYAIREMMNVRMVSIAP